MIDCTVGLNKLTKYEFRKRGEGVWIKTIKKISCDCTFVFVIMNCLFLELHFDVKWKSRSFEIN